jgi:acetylornithine deacetylase/succinyl-diaminopimelate desuccinylase-like protein
VRISTTGPFMHTAWASSRASENSIARMAEVLPHVRTFVDRWGEDLDYEGVPAVGNIGSINGGFPWRASRSPHRTDVFLDLRVPPDHRLIDARARVKRFINELRSEFPDAGIEFEIYVSTPGAIIDEDSPLVTSVAAAHRQVHGEQAARDVAHWYSDAGALHAYGVPTLNYGTASGLPNAELGENLGIDALVAATQIYTLTIADLCGAAT